jgi:hypothetical protein
MIAAISTCIGGAAEPAFGGAVGAWASMGEGGWAATGLAAAAPPKIEDMMFPNTDIFPLPML